MESEFQFHECQEIVQYELEELVQLLLALELRHKFWNLTQHEGMYTLCMLEFHLLNHHLRLQRFCGTSQTTTLFKNDASSQTVVDCMLFSSVSISEDILAICFQIRDHYSLEFAPKNLLLAVSHSSVIAHFLLLRTFPKSALSLSASDRILHTSLRLLRRY